LLFDTESPYVAQVDLELANLLPSPSKCLDYRCVSPHAAKTFILTAMLLSRCWWFIAVILVTWEADVRKIKVRGQPRQIVFETASSK
jgi:hypothetical protein